MKRDWRSTISISWTLALPLFAVFLLLQQTSVPQRLDYWLYDSLITAYPAPVDDRVVLVAVDEQSLDQLGRWPWPRSTHAELIQKLHAAGARTIVFDILFPEPSPDDLALAAAMRAHGGVVLPLHLASLSNNRLISEQPPTPTLRQAAAALGHAHVELDADGLARGLYQFNGLGTTLWPSLGYAAAHLSEGPRPSTADSPTDASPYVNVRQDYVAVPLAGRSGTITTYSFSDVLASPPAPLRFQGKTVFVGATASGFGDILPTPFSALTNPVSGVEFHANSYSALLNDRLIRTEDGPITLLLPLAALVILILLLPKLRPARTPALCAAVLGGLLLIFVACLFGAGLWVPISSAMLVPVIAFPLWSARRLALTNRFLNRQLDELGRRHQLQVSQPSERHPLQILEHLTMLLEAEGWWLSKGDDIMAHHKLTSADRPDLSNESHWVHQDQQSWVSFRRGNHTYELGLTLPTNMTLEANRRYLQRLSLSSSDENLPVNRYRENISARIEKVRIATERLNGMQEFIGRSFETMPDGIIVTDSLGVIQFINGHIEEWFNEPRPSLIGMPIIRLLHGHDPRESPPWPETIAETLTLQQSRTVDLEVRGMDFLIHFAPFTLPDNDQSGLIANISNISELREQQRQHREAIDFISHDVRSPLVSQLALIEQLKRRPGEIHPDQLDQLGRLARRSYQLAEEFVQLARAEQLTETRFYECEFLAIVENARDSVSEQAAEKGIRLHLLGNQDLWLNGNAELLERAVINLLTNAVQYSPTGSTITLQVFQAGHQACLTVSDEGSGIAQAEIPFLFDRFRRQKSSELSGNHGTGLGLSFVNVVVEKHRGEIRVVSREGVGSAFTLRLPIAHLME
ncbi:CHASE2 domain-containing protein [Marinobacter caseinilyticus]|uniref:CHASE2 domain-containing protein n=1 Tax=Marinobacter caseinilyticus TaxID=2692195 RepID=UPI001408BDA9|nr:CHASE2 domain-containing protein [Marinobacter caseinilyticus]